MLRIIGFTVIAAATLALTACGNPSGASAILNAPMTAETQRAPLFHTRSSVHGILYAGILNSSPSEVLEYEYPYKHISGRITNAVALGNCCLHECNDGMIVDRAGELFVANYGDNTVTGYATPEYLGKKPGTLLTVISSGITQPCDLAVDSENDLFVTLGGGHSGSALNEYAPPYKHLTRQVYEGCAIGWAEVNSKNELFVQSCNEIDEFILPKWRKHVIYSRLDHPTAFAFDENDNLFVANTGNSMVTEYACCNYSGPPIQTLAFRFDELSQIFVYHSYVCAVNGGNSTIICTAPPYTSTITITNGLYYPGYAIVDQHKNLLVSNCCPAGRIAVFTWPWVTGSDGGNLSRKLHVDAWPIAYVP